MKNKSDVSYIVPRFFKLVETQFHKTIKKFRLDNAPELRFTDFFHSKGVLHQFTCVERPEQNSDVERKHQHLLNVARALFFQSQIPIKFWSECILTATFIINRLPSPILQNKSPFSILYNAPIDYSQFKVFGSLCFASTLPSSRTKFHPRARTCVFMGYPPGINGYKVYDIVSKTFFISRDVIFHEHIFPFQSIPYQSDVIDPFPDLAIPIFVPELLLSTPQPNIFSDEHSESTNNIHELQPSSPPINTPSINNIPRKSVRCIRPPSYLRDFHCNLLINTPQPYESSPYPLSK